MAIRVLMVNVGTMHVVDKLNQICLLCTEKTAGMYHKRLVAEYTASQIPNVKIAKYAKQK